MQDAILAAINSVMSRKEVLIEQIADAMRMELLPNDGTGMSVGDIDRLIGAQEQKFEDKKDGPARGHFPCRRRYRPRSEKRQGLQNQASDGFPRIMVQLRQPNFADKTTAH